MNLTARQEWYKALHILFTNLGFACSAYDHAVFFKTEDTETYIVAIHVDDLTLATNSETTMAKLKQCLGTYSELVELGPIHWLLDIKVEQDRQAHTLSLLQGAYIDKMLEHFRLKDTHSASIPLNPGPPLTDNQSLHAQEDQDDMQGILYKQLVRSLLYIAWIMWPNVSFVVALLSCFMKKLGQTHWEAAKRVLRYLKGTQHTALTYGSHTNRLLADWVSQDH